MTAEASAVGVCVGRDFRCPESWFRLAAEAAAGLCLHQVSASTRCVHSSVYVQLHRNFAQFELLPGQEHIICVI